MISEGIRAILRWAAGKKWLDFRDPVEVCAAGRLSEVMPCLERVQAAVEKRGLWAAGFVSYEAAPAFDAALAVAPVSALVLASGRPRGALRALLGLSAAAPFVYLAGLGAASARLGGDGVRDHALNIGALATIHTSWGLGFLRGWTRGAAQVVDSSRVTRR